MCNKICGSIKVYIGFDVVKKSFLFKLWEASDINDSVVDEKILKDVVWGLRLVVIVSELDLVRDVNPSFILVVIISNVVVLVSENDSVVVSSFIIAVDVVPNAFVVVSSSVW